MIYQGVKGWMYNAIHRHTKANNKYMKDYDLRIQLPYLMYWDVSNLYGWSDH